jgi:hypothetical protein
VFICAGIYPQNHIIYDTSEAAAQIEDYLQLQGGKIFLEGGDVWCGDPQSQHGYDFCPLFAIEPISNTIGLFPGVDGCDATLTEDMYFPYGGATTLIDNIDATSAGAVVFRNTRNGYGCGVAKNHQTVGISFELGGLTDTLSSTKHALLDSIMDYFEVPPTDTQERDTYDGRVDPYLVIQPNPSFRHVKISYGGISPAAHIVVEIYDISGRLIKQNEFQSHSQSSEHFYWNGTDDNDRRVPQGIYFIKIQTGDYHKTEKVVFLQ